MAMSRSISRSGAGRGVRGRLALLLGVFGLLAVSQARLCAEEWYSRGGVHYEHRLEVVLRNPLPVDRREEPVVLAVADIRKQAPDFPGKAWVVVDPAAAPDSPCGIEANGNDVPSQLDDLDGDGKADELVILASLKGNEAKSYHVYYTDKNSPLPLYPKRTQIVDFTRADPNTLFAIESDVLAFRFNRTAAGAPGFVGDVLAKNNQFPGYSLHLYDQKLPLWNYGNMPFREYAELTPVGRCIVNPFDAPGQLGIGSVLAWEDGAWRMAEAPNVTTRARMLIDGRLRSVGEIETSNWQVGDGVYDVKACYSMYAGQRHMRCDLTVTAKRGERGRFALGLMKLENEKSDIQAGRGRLSLWGDRPAINERDIGLSVLFQSADVEAVEEAPGGRAIELKNSPTAREPLRATLYLSGGCKDEKRPVDYFWAALCPDLTTKSCGDFNTEKGFFDFHAGLAQRLTAPIGVEVAGVESRIEQPVREPLRQADLFLANPSNKSSMLPGELDWGLMDWELAGAIEASVKDAMVDVVGLDGSARVFIRKAAGPLGVEKVSLRAGAAKDAGNGITVEKVNGDEGGVLVSSGKAKWLVTGSGLRKVSVGDKELAIEQPGVSGAVNALHNGPVVAIVRVGGDKEYTDYYFFTGTDIVRVVANHGLGFRSGEARSYVGKKELRVMGCERTDVGAWGRWSSDSVFDRVSVLYPAEWCALYSADRKVGLMCYGTPSAVEIVVQKGGKLDSALASGCQRQELYLAPIETIEEGEALWPVMSRPFVFMAHKDGFVCFEDRNGNGVRDTVYVTDRNGNRMPDFDGDRWAFDMDSDDALQMVLEFEAKPGRMKVFCDTVSGSWLHSNVLAAYFGNGPEPLVGHGAVYAPSSHRHKYDGVLSPAELEEPFYVHECIGDGFFKGPVTEGGFIASGKVTAFRAGPGCIGFLRQAMYTCLDLDDDGDCDIYMLDGDRPAGVEGEQHDRWVDFLVFDLSDNNLEPLTVVNPYTGLAYQAHRYFSFLMQDNSKVYNLGYRDRDGIICGWQNWPQAGTWDIDNDGVAEAHIYHEMQHTMGINLANKWGPEDVWVKERWNLQRDIYAEKWAIPVNFAIRTDWDRPAGVHIRERALPAETFPVNTYTDPHGNSLSVSADFLPDKWHGERLDCKTWPDGQWDYWPTNNWNSFIQKKYRFLSVHFWRPGLNNHSEHEGCWNSIFFNPDTRTEIDSDGTSSFYIYRSPFLNGLHYKGMEFGLQFMHDVEDHAKFVAPYFRDVWATPPGGGNPEKMDEYYIPQEMCNDYSRTTRVKGRMFLYYLDEDRDGYADTYLLDDENDGYFEKRMWYQKDKGILSVYDGGMLGVAARKLDFPGYSLELKNYEKLVDMYRDSLTSPGLLREVSIKNGRCENTGATFSAVLSAGWLPQVAVDAFHTKEKKDLWSQFASPGLDTLARVISQQPVRVTSLKEEYSSESLSGIDVLIISRISELASEAELRALDEYVRGGGILILMAGADEYDDAAPCVELARRFGVAVGRDKVLSVSYREWEEAHVPETFSLKADKPVVIDGGFDEWSDPKSIELAMKWGASPSRPTPYDVKSDVYLRWDEDNFYLGAEVWDKNLFNEQRGERIWDGDCIQFALGKGGKYQEYGIALTPRGPEVYRWIPQAGPVAGANLAVRREGNKTIYELALPWDEVGDISADDGTQLDFSLLLWDRASDREVESAAWGGGIKDGKNPSLFRRLTLTQSKEEFAQSVTPATSRAEDVRGTARDYTDGELLQGVAPFYLEGRGLEPGERGAVLLEWRGTPLISETSVGEGKVLVIASDVFENKYMCLESKMRMRPYKPGNQKLAENVMKHLLAPREPKIDRLACTPEKAELTVRGKGGPLNCGVPWESVRLSVNGKEQHAEWEEGTVLVKAPAGESTIQISPR